MRFKEFKPMNNLLLNHSNQPTINAIRRNIEALKLRLSNEREKAKKARNRFKIAQLVNN
jgi:hypothetical protein